MLEVVRAEAVKAEAEMQNAFSGVSKNQQEITSLRTPKWEEDKVCRPWLPRFLPSRSVDVVEDGILTLYDIEKKCANITF